MDFDHERCGFPLALRQVRNLRFYKDVMLVEARKNGRSANIVGAFEELGGKDGHVSRRMRRMDEGGSRRWSRWAQMVNGTLFLFFLVAAPLKMVFPKKGSDFCPGSLNN